MTVKMTNIKFKKFLKWIDYRVNDSAPFQWKCFGENALFFNHISDDKQVSICAIVDLKDQTVYEVNVTRRVDHVKVKHRRLVLTISHISL